MYTENHVELNMMNIVKVNHIFLIISFSRIYYVLRFIIYIQEYMSPSVNRTCKTFFIKKSFIFALKSAMASKPIKNLLGLTTLALFGYAYALKIFERRLQPSFGYLVNCLWAIGISFPTVGFGDYVARSLAGRTIMILSVISGLLFYSMLIVAILNFTVLDKAEKIAYSILNGSSKLKAMDNSAKQVINSFWKIAKSKHNLFNTVTLKKKLYYELRRSLQKFEDATEEYEYSQSLETKEYRKIIVTLSCIMKNYETLKKQHSKLQSEMTEIFDKLYLLNE
jgi:hypothetical protein